MTDEKLMPRAKAESELAREAGDVEKPGKPASEIPAHEGSNEETRGAPVSIERHPSPQTTADES